MLKNIQLDDRARDYVKSCLEHGNSYARSLLNLPSLGTITTFLPEQLDSSQIDFSLSVYLTTGIRIYDDTRKEIFGMADSFLLKGQKRCVLLETYYDPDDLKKMTNLPDVVYYGNEIFFLLKASANLQDVIKVAFSISRHYPFVCGLLDLSMEKTDLQQNQKITDNQWNALVRGTLCIIVGAFDNESYLIWNRS